MRLIPRRPALPADVAAVINPDGERLLAVAPLVGGGWAAVTPSRLCLVSPLSGVVRRPWAEVDHASWDDVSATLAIWWVGSRAATAVELAAPSRLPEALRERVNASILITRDVALPGGGRATVSLRKAADGTLTPQVNLPTGTRRGDPGVAEAVDAVVRALREEAGL